MSSRQEGFLRGGVGNSFAKPSRAPCLGLTSEHRLQVHLVWPCVTAFLGSYLGVISGKLSCFYIP